VWGMMGALAAAVGPPIGGLLVASFGWRSVFLVNVPIAAGATLAGLVWLSESRGDRTADRVDLISVPAASLGVGAIVLAIVEQETWGPTSLTTLVTVAVGLALIGVFVFRSSRHPAPLFDLDLFKLRSYSLAAVGTVAFVVGFFAFFVPFPSFLQEQWGWSAFQVGLVIMAGPLLAAVLSPLAGRLADRIGNGPIVAVGGLAGVVSMALHLIFTNLEPNVVLGAIVPNLFLGVTAGCSFAMSVGAAMRDIPARQFGMAGAGRTTVFQLSIALAIALAVAIIGDPGSPAEHLSSMRIDWTLCLIAFALQALIFGLFFPRGNPAAQAL
ncbi:MAG: MFS transporter, partial [Acidimicrobiia bacterium]|nr:MFS transporter [Acidimicrobiia bacterium]